MEVVFIAVLASAALVVRALWRPPRTKAFRAFAQVAERLGGRYLPSTYVPSLRVELGGLELVAKLHGLAESEGRALTTEVLADAPSGPLLVLLPLGVATTWGHAFGGQSVRTGDAAFDARFMVKAADAGLARAWLTGRVRDALMNADSYGYELVHGRVTTSRPGWEVDADRLHAALVATAALARAGAELYAGWCEVAAELGASLPAGASWPAGGLGFDLVVLGAPLRVECTRRPPERDAWQIRLLAPATGRELPPELEDELEALAAEAGLEGAGVFVRWEGVEPDRDRLARAVALLSAWAGARGGAAYR